MARKHAYRNDRTAAGTKTDLAGQTVNDDAHPNELRCRENAGFLDEATGHQSYNTDGTKTSAPAEDELISSYIACEVCGFIVTDKRQLKKCGGSKGVSERFRCKDCQRDC